MLIGVIADTHDNLPRLAAALRVFRERGVAAVLHAGDYVAPFSMKLLMQAEVPVVGVFGNNDGERAGLLKLCDALYDAPHRVELGGRTIVLAHAEEQVTGGAADGADLIVFGHTHEARVDPGPPLIVNPGEAGGWVNGISTAALIDLRDLTVEIVELDGQETEGP